MATEGESPPRATPQSPPSGSAHTLEARTAGVQQFFLRELNRRNVVRVGVLYLIVCWLILEPVHVVFHMLEVPAWANRLVIVLMAIGFPAVLLFAWAYELTPEGVKPAAQVERRTSITTQTARRLDRAIILVLALALAYFVADKFWLSRARPVPAVAVSAPEPAAPVDNTTTESSIAVLPFVDMSERRDQEYFSDGLAEELIDLLSRTPDLRVVARTSSFQFKGRNEDVRSIARQLGVANLLEGSVRKSGATMRVTAQLIKAADGSHLWSETYDRELNDIFRVQDDICGTVVKALKLALNPGPRTQALAQNMDAYNALLRGKYFAERFTKEDTDKAITLLQESIRLDPNYALAWAELADAKFVRLKEGWAGVSEQVGYAEVQSAIERALQLDPHLSRAHGIRGEIFFLRDFDWARAQAEFALDPDSPATQQQMAQIAATFGHLEESIEQLRRALLRDPLSTEAHWSLARELLHAGRAQEADVQLHKLLEIHPLGARTHYGLGLTLIARKRYPEALEQMQRETDDGWRKAGLPLAYWALGRRTEADAALETVKAEYADVGAFQIAEIYAYRGETDLALAWLDRAYRQRDPGMSWVTTDPFLQDLRADPRYRTLLAKLKLPPQSP